MNSSLGESHALLLPAPSHDLQDAQTTQFSLQNELISDTPNATFKDIIWTRKFGEEAMPKALAYARAADPQPKL